MTFKKVKCYSIDRLIGEYPLKQISDNSYSFTADNIETTITINKDFIKIKRENDNFLLDLLSNNSTANFALKENRLELKIAVLKFDVTNNNNELTIIYKLESMDEEIKIVLESVI